MKLTKKSIYIGLFGVLYLIVAFSSFFHACAFFGLANNSWMSIILAFAFEVGQAAVLFSLLTSSKDRSRIMPWVLMTMFTLVQVIGNVYSSYKYIILNSVENLRYFKEPIFIWTDLPDAQANVIIVYLVGALLPIAALLLTSMITNYLSDNEDETNKNQKNELPTEEQHATSSNVVEDTGERSKIISGTGEGTKRIEETSGKSTEGDSESDDSNSTTDNTEERESDDKDNEVSEEKENVTVEEPIEEKVEDLPKEEIKDSHFINL